MDTGSLIKYRTWCLTRGPRWIHHHAQQLATQGHNDIQNNFVVMLLDKWIDYQGFSIDGVQGDLDHSLLYYAFVATLLENNDQFSINKDRVEKLLEETKDF